MAREFDQSPAVLRSLQSLRPSGAKSLEQLICLLLSDISGIPFRRARAGHQGGIDSRSETGVGVEVKRYGPTRPLSERELLGELGQVANSYPDLQAWVLATTQEVPGDLVKRLESQCLDLGLAFVCLDYACGHPLDCPAISALAAVNSDRLLDALSGEGWLDPAQPPFEQVNEVDRELHQIREDSQFDSWAKRLREQLQGLPTWDRVRRQQNRRLRRQIVEEPYLCFGTLFDPDRAVPRDVEQDMNAWIKSSQAEDEPPLCVVLGERYDGKSWAMFHWLLTASESQPFPVFLFGAKTADRERKLIDLIEEEVSDLLSVKAPQAKSLVRRFRHQSAGSGPWALIVLDGLNEYRAHPEAPLDLIVQAAARFDEDRRSAAVMVTVRSSWWNEQSTKLGQRTREKRIVVGPYSEEELQVALEIHGEDTNVISGVPASAETYLRRPRYLGLVIDHKDQLQDFGAITTDVLHYLDAMDKVRDRGYLASAVAWDHHAYSEFLRDLAKSYLAEGGTAAFIERTEVNELLTPIIDERRTALRDLESAGVVVPRDEGYSVDPARLATGMSLWLPRVLMDASQKENDLREVLRELLEPMAETDEKVEWLKSAVTVALLKQPSNNSSNEVLDVLIDAWLRSRNLGKHVLDDVRTLAHRLLPSLVSLAEKTWSDYAGDRRLQEISLLIFSWAARQDPFSRERQLMEKAARGWCRQIPKMGSRFLNSDDKEAELQRRLADPSVASIGLEPADDEGVLSLQRVSLYLETVTPGLLDAESILAVVAVSVIAVNPLDSAERRVVRTVLARSRRTWFKRRRSEGGDGERWRAIWFDLVRFAKRADLTELAAMLASPPSPADEQLRAQWLFTLDNYLQRSPRPPSPDEKLQRFAAQCRPFVIDPKLPRPVNERVHAITKCIESRFSAVRLQRTAEMHSEDHEFKDVVPSLAAWAPETGVVIVQNQIADLPRRLTSTEVEQPAFFTHDLNRHSVAVRGRTRQSLRSVAEAAYPDSHRQFAAALAFVALLPGLATKARLEAIIDHSLRLNGQPFEWRQLYELAAFMADQSFVQELLARLETEEDPTKTIRLRLLAVQIGDVSVGEMQKGRLSTDIRAPNTMTRYSAVAAAATCSNVSLPVDSLLELVRNGNERSSLTPRYAAYLLVRERQNIDDLSIVWQAHAAVRYTDRREQFFNEVERALMYTAEPGEVATFPHDIQIRLREGVAQTVGVEHGSERSTVIFSANRPGLGGLEGPTPVDPKAVFEDWKGDKAIEKKNRLATEAATRFAEQAGEHDKVWQSELFPQALVDSLPAERFLRWSNLLISRGAPTPFLWTGLLQPMLRRAIRDGLPIAAKLFDLVYPFHRQSSGGQVRFTENDIHLTLLTLFEADADEATALDILDELLRDCRNDFELLQVVVAARSGRVRLLEQVVEEWLEDTDDDLRALATRLAGWLPEFGPRLAAIAASDRSLYVRDVAETALGDWIREHWARHWFGRFVADCPFIDRWAAAQLFLECADHRVYCWAWAELKAVRRMRTRGEGYLLLRAVDHEAQRVEQKLKDRFLEVKVHDLTNLCHPWRAEDNWQRLGSSG